MQTIRVYDPDRRPTNWTEIIVPGQFVAFSQQLGSGGTCDATGTPVAPDAVTCLLFDSLPAAAAFCRERVEQMPTLRFDIFDSTGRTSPPLLTVVHSSHAGTLEGNRRSTRMMRWAAIALVTAAPIMFWLDWAKYDGMLILPTFLGINFLIIAARLFQLNSAYASAESARRERLAQHVDHDEP